VAAEPEKFFLPIPSELRYQWIEVNLTAIDAAEMAELIQETSEALNRLHSLR